MNDSSVGRASIEFTWNVMLNKFIVVWNKRTYISSAALSAFSCFVRAIFDNCIFSILHWQYSPSNLRRLTFGGLDLFPGVSPMVIASHDDINEFGSFKAFSKVEWIENNVR